MSGTPVENAIRRLRFARGEMTQQALADACSVTRQTIIALEAGKYAPSLELAFRIAYTFSVQLSDVFAYFPENDPVHKKVIAKQSKKEKQ